MEAGAAPWHEPPRLFAQHQRPGSGVPGDERSVRPAVRRHPAEARQSDLATERARRLSGQFIIDGHTHFLSDDLAPDNINARFAGLRNAVGKFGLNPELAKQPQTLEHLKFKNYVKEMFLDSDTKIVGISGAPGDDVKEWFLSNDRKAEARDHVNNIAGSRRVLSHAVFTPGQPGWLEEIDRCVEKLKPDAWKGYTIGDNNRPDKSRYPWRLDDEKVTYPGYEKMLKSGIRNVCIHKGCFPRSSRPSFPICSNTPPWTMSRRRPRTGPI